MEKIILDTNVLIEVLKGNTKTIQKIKSFTAEPCISAVSAMELYYGALNKREMIKLEKFVALFHVVHLSESISITATGLIKKYAKSHGLDIPDSLIAATALQLSSPLFSYNNKDFRYIDKLELT